MLAGSQKQKGGSAIQGEAIRKAFSSEVTKAMIPRRFVVLDTNSHRGTAPEQQILNDVCGCGGFAYYLGGAK
jgi:hypothetical protein